MIQTGVFADDLGDGVMGILDDAGFCCLCAASDLFG